jgi:hypothetical protein
MADTRPRLVGKRIEIASWLLLKSGLVAARGMGVRRARGKFSELRHSAMNHA